MYISVVSIGLPPVKVLPDIGLELVTNKAILTKDVASKREAIITEFSPSTKYASSVLCTARLLEYLFKARIPNIIHWSRK